MTRDSHNLSKEEMMNTARFYPRKTRFTPDSATHASRDLRRHSAAAPPTELRRSHRKRARNHRNSGALCPRQLPTIGGPIFARFCLFPPIISTLSPPVTAPPTPHCSTLRFLFCLFVFNCVPSQPSYFQLFKPFLQYSSTLGNLTTSNSLPVITYSHIQPSFPIVSRTI